MGGGGIAPRFLNLALDGR